ncbi:hypothetical protein [Mycoplasma phage sp.]|nr:hypothetical protein [Mycoplasma phage sp.]
MYKTAQSFKDSISNRSKAIGISAEILFARYMMDRFLDRLSNSIYQQHFIFKGGLLISSLLGIENRTTMDIDTTVRNITFSKENINSIISDILKIDVNDNIQMKIWKIENIMKTRDNPGFRVIIECSIEKAKFFIRIDVSTGDCITPNEIEYTYETFIENKKLNLKTYPIETILSEKVQTILSRGKNNTRMRDFYDIHLLVETQKYNKNLFKQALINTCTNRNSLYILNDPFTYLKELENDDTLLSLWVKYQNTFPYAKSVKWECIFKSINKLIRVLEE